MLSGNYLLMASILGRVPNESKQERKVHVEVKAACTVETDMPGLAIFPTHLSPGPHTLSLEYNASGKLPGTLLDGKISLRSETEIKTIVVTGSNRAKCGSPFARGRAFFNSNGVILRTPA